MMIFVSLFLTRGPILELWFDSKIPDLVLLEISVYQIRKFVSRDQWYQNFTMVVISSIPEPFV